MARVWVVLVTSWKVQKQRKVEVKDTRAKVFPTKKAAAAWVEAETWGVWREYTIQEATVEDDTRGQGTDRQSRSQAG